MVSVGADVTLSCPRLNSDIDANLFWIRFIPGSWPEFLGGTYSFDFENNDNEITHIKAKQAPETFSLYISKVKESDAGLYYCIKVELLILTFLKGEFLRIKGTEPNITAIIQHPLPDLVHPGNPVSLQCSVLFNSQDKTSPMDHRVYWFQAGSNKSYPSFIYAHGNRDNECENSPEDHSGRKCVYNFSKNVSASDDGTYYCAVASCGVVLFGNGTKLDIEGSNKWDMQKTNTAFILLCALLMANVVVIFILIYIIRKKACHCSNDAVRGHDDQQIQQRDEVSLVYTAPTFTNRKDPKSKRGQKEKSEAVYSGVSGLGID
ncbi:hypothetical protein AMECASPLE_021744 [Ameca splendens]|uniref:Ig-like domain-containing protein n=1 Tax=Ameca splendens TaxID=208324 RepID=A0ABV0YEZ9_9TELE